MKKWNNLEIIGKIRKFLEKKHLYKKTRKLETQNKVQSDQLFTS